MKQSNIGIAVVGAGRIGTLRARLAAKHPSVRFLAISDRDPARARKLAEAGWRRPPHRQQRRGDRPSRRDRRHRLDAGAGAHAADPHGARARQAGAGREADRVLAHRRRHDPRHLARDQGQSPRRLQPPLQGLLPARQGADAARPPRQGRRRHGARLQFPRPGVRHPQARSACDAGARRADLLRRPDVLVPGRQPAGRGGGARPARHFQGGRLRRARRDLGDRHLRRRRGDQSRRQLRAARALSHARPVRPRGAARHRRHHDHRRRPPGSPAVSRRRASRTPMCRTTT